VLVTEHVWIDLVSLAHGAVIEMPLVVVEEPENLLQGEIGHLDGFAVNLLNVMAQEPKAMRARTGSQSRASEVLIRKIRKIGIRQLERFGCGRRILDRICRGESVSDSTLYEYEKMIREYKLMRVKAGTGQTQKHAPAL
jgi:hypothetical protein